MDFLNENYKNYSTKYKHRTDIKDINNINEIKDYILNKLGYISVFFFLNVILVKFQYKYPYRTIEKGLLILYHLLAGKSLRGMHEYIAHTSFHEI